MSRESARGRHSRVAPRPHPRRFREWPIVVVLTCVALSLGVVAANHFRRGTYLLSATVLLATVLRLVLPTREAGLLAVRGRFADVVILGGLAVCLITLSILVPRPS
jgi:hypothetical protein